MYFKFGPICPKTYLGSIRIILIQRHTVINHVLHRGIRKARLTPVAQTVERLLLGELHRTLIHLEHVLRLHRGSGREDVTRAAIPLLVHFRVDVTQFRPVETSRNHGTIIWLGKAAALATRKDVQLLGFTQGTVWFYPRSKLVIQHPILEFFMCLPKYGEYTTKAYIQLKTGRRIFY